MRFTRLKASFKVLAESVVEGEKGFWIKPQEKTKKAKNGENIPKITSLLVEFETLFWEPHNHLT